MHGTHSSLRFAPRRLHEFKIWLRDVSQQQNNKWKYYIGGNVCTNIRCVHKKYIQYIHTRITYLYSIAIYTVLQFHTVYKVYIHTYIHVNESWTPHSATSCNYLFSMKTCQKRFTSSAASHRDLLLGAFLNTLYVEVLISSQCEPWKLAQQERKIKQLQVRSVDNGQKSIKL